MGPGCRITLLPPRRRGLRLGVRGLCAPPLLELALSEGRPRSPQGQFRGRGVSGGDVPSLSLSPTSAFARDAG